VAPRTGSALTNNADASRQLMRQLSQFNVIPTGVTGLLAFIGPLDVGVSPGFGRMNIMLGCGNSEA